MRLNGAVRSWHVAIVHHAITTHTLFIFLFCTSLCIQPKRQTNRKQTTHHSNRYITPFSLPLFFLSLTLEHQKEICTHWDPRMSHDRSRHPRKSSADLATYRERDREREEGWILVTGLCYFWKREKTESKERGGEQQSHRFPSSPNASLYGFLSVFSLIVSFFFGGVFSTRLLAGSDPPENGLCEFEECSCRRRFHVPGAARVGFELTETVQWEEAKWRRGGA